MVSSRSSFFMILTTLQSRAKVLAAAFSRSLRDPFVHARNAALLALSATADLFSEEDCAIKLLPIMCSSLVDKEKIIRDQAQKSVDIYIARIRKYAATMPDTVLPPPGVATAGAGAPRMGTPANDSSWTGWAISSFTNKMASTSGDIQAGSASNGAAEQRPSSVPLAATSKPPVPLASKPGMQIHSTRSTASIPTVTSPNPVPSFDDEAEDFNDDWGGFGDDDGFGNSTAAKADGEEEPWGTPAVSKPTATTSFDDQGEPDFAGWLAAQSQSKKAIKSPLPKGLTKSSAPAAKTTRPIVGGRSSTMGSATRKVVVPAKKEIKKLEPKPKQEDEEVEGWGDEW